MRQLRFATCGILATVLSCCASGGDRQGVGPGAEATTPVPAATSAVPDTNSSVPDATVGPDASEPPVPPLALRFGTVRERQVDVHADGRTSTAAIAGMNQFAVDVFNAVAATEPANVVIGPYSIANALGMVYGGARGATAAEMAGVLHSDAPADDWHEGINAYDLTLDARTTGSPTEWVTADKVWAQRGLPLRDEYLDLLTGVYGSALAEADFAGDPDAERAVINEWVSAVTHDRITELFPAGTISAETVLALVNAVALDAPWEFPFDPALTTDQPFHRADGSSVSVPTMHYAEYLPSLWTEDLQAVEIPYSGGTLSMIVIVPTDLAGFESTMTAATLDDIVGRITDGGIHLSLPKWSGSTHVGLNDILSGLGMASAFTPAADFSGMTGAAGLFLGTVEHEAFVEVDEAGTRAAAATGGAMLASHGPTITVDRPFLYLIRDMGAGTTLFIGHMLDPGED